MTSREFVDAKIRLEHLFRHVGLDGHMAFDAICHHYVLQYTQLVEFISPDVRLKWEAAHKRLQSSPITLDYLSDLVVHDAKGEKLAEWYQFFVGRRYREGSGKFFTPSPIAAVMAQLLPVNSNPVIMDPTCGGGTFLIEVAKTKKDDLCTLIANDIEPSLIELSMLSLAFSGSPRHRLYFSVENIYQPTRDFHQWYGCVDCILANPPFSIRIEELTHNSRLFAAGYRTSDSLFIDVALDLLKPGGRLVCLLPHSIISNKEFAEFRKIVERDWSLVSVVALPEGVFSLNAGTTTRADIVILDKRGGSPKTSKTAAFASVPTVGIRLNNSEANTVSNDLYTLLENRHFRHVLGIADDNDT